MLDWSQRPAHRMGSALIGKVILMPGLEYKIEIFGDMASSSTPAREHYVVGLEAFGCSAGKSFYTKEETQNYLQDQLAKVSQFKKVKAKREAIAARILPLQKKWDGCSEEIFKLLGVR